MSPAEQAAANAERARIVADLRAMARRQRASGFEGNLIAARTIEACADRIEKMPGADGVPS